MGGRLTNKDMDQLEKWIGTGPKSFTLLYAIATDGCNAKLFHEKCDEKGPTVTVLYNTEGSVFGGYSPSTWNSSEIHFSSVDAFLFQLRYNGNQKTNMFVVKKGHHCKAVHNDPNYGPIFGKYDLLTFRNTVNRSGSHFPLNGSTDYGKTYEMQGSTANDINNGHLKVVELEVYKVAYDEKKIGKPWRSIGDWNKKQLKEEIIAFKLLPDLKTQHARIALIGPVGAGKSSLYNTIDSIFRGRITQRACSGSAEQSITSGYMPYTVKTDAGASLNVLLCDTPGLEESAGLEEEECGYLLDGKIPDFYQFNSKSPVPTNTEDVEDEVTSREIIHCVVFVLDSTTLDVVSSEVIEKMKGFQTLMNQRGIPQLIILTKIDKLCKDVQSDVSFTYKSWLVEEQVEKASQLLGLRRANVLPVKNYEAELKVDLNINILTLLALRQILHSAEDFMHNLLDRQRFAQMRLREN